MPRTKINTQQRAYQRIPRRKPEAEPQKYTKFPHEYGDLLIQGGKLGGTIQRDVLYWIERQTIGHATRPEWARLSLTKLAQLCSWYDPDAKRLRAAERKSIAVALADLERREIIASRDRTGCGKTVTKMYKLTPEKWKAAAPYVPPTRKQLEEAEAEAEAEAELEPVPEGDAATEDTQTVQDGKISRPAPVAIRPGKGAEPVTIRISYNPQGFNFPVRFRTRCGANGRLQISASPHIGEVKANDYGCTQPQLAKSFVENKRVSDFNVAINAISVKTWGTPATDALVTRIVSAAGSASVELFSKIATRKLRAEGAAERHTPGLLVNLAAEAAETQAANDRWTAQRAAAAAAGRRQTPKPREWPQEAANARETAVCARCKGKGHTEKTQYLPDRGAYGPVRVECKHCAGKGTTPK